MTTAFRQSVEAMIPALRRYARALARDADIADDLVQDTLVRALRSERLFLGGDVRSWLYTILTNLNKNRRRSLARRPKFMPLLDNNPDASGTEAEGRDIARALATLVEEQRAVLLLVMLEGLGELPLGDMRDEAEVGAGGAQVVVHVEGGEVAVIPSATEQGREVTVQIPDDLPETPLDFVLISQVLTNLLDNAVRYSPEHAGITISAEVVRDQLRVTVSDTGRPWEETASA